MLEDFVDKRTEKYLLDKINKLNNSNVFDDMKIEYVLYNKQNNEFKVLISDGYESSYEDRIDVFSNKIINEMYVPEWDFNFDYYIFKDLEDKNNRLLYVSPNTHYGLWNSLHELYPDDIDSKNGVQRYLKFCKQNHITKEKIEKYWHYNKLPEDCMKFYNGKDKER